MQYRPHSRLAPFLRQPELLHHQRHGLVAVVADVGPFDASPADAAVREVKEETGLEVRAGEVIGQRVHPATGRQMIYMAARSVRGTPFVGEESELAEVRWASPAEVATLMPDMYGPVRDHLAATIGSA